MSKIEYVDKSWNPVTGCTKISNGCKNCWAERMAGRLQGMGVYGYENGFEVTYQASRINVPYNRKKATRYDVCFMGDIFHAKVKENWIKIVFERMIRNNQHTYLVLTKRPKRMRDFISNVYDNCDRKLPNNIWLGISIEDQMSAKARLPYFKMVRHKNLWISYEPALEYVDFRGYNFIRWMVVGGESGPNKRLVKKEWLRSARDWCRSNNIEIFVKQIDKVMKIPVDLQIFEIPGN